jgi:hypothetical protein
MLITLSNLIAIFWLEISNFSLPEGRFLLAASADITYTIVEETDVQVLLYMSNFFFSIKTTCRVVDGNTVHRQINTQADVSVTFLMLNR